MNFRTRLEENVVHTGPMHKHFQHCRSLLSVKGFGLIYLLLSLAGCNGDFNSAPPSSSAPSPVLGVGGPAPVHTTDARLAYVFSDDIILYNPPCPGGGNGCWQTIMAGNPVNSYSVDPASGTLSSIGIPGDITPPNTISIAASPSDNFTYMLTGENLVYTFSIGYLTFSKAEFVNQNLDPLKLFNALSTAGYISEPVFSSDQAVEKLISLLEDTALYDRIAAKNPNMAQTGAILALKAKTVNIRGTLFSSLTYSEKKSIINLNRLTIELVYPDETPKNKGESSLHAVGTPAATLPVSTYSSVSVEPLGQFAYVVGSSLGIYSINQTTGALVSRSTQPMGFGQLIFAPSGQFAYGSTNGTLNSYRIDRATGQFTESAPAISFTGWVNGADFNLPPPPFPWQGSPFHNMAADPTGKFLYLIGSSGTSYSPDELGNCPGPMHQIGSLVYTFMVDQNTGLLTQSGPPLDTTPHIMTWGAVDPFSRFVQLLNTHEYSGEDFTPGACSGNSTYPLLPGSIYSFYVDQNTGHLFPSGSVAAGGREYPTGFLNTGDGGSAVSITGDTTGRFLYLLNAGDMYVYGVDQADGALTPVGSPLTGATATPMPGKSDPPNRWPSICYTNSVLNGHCRVTGSRAHSITWAGY